MQQLAYPAEVLSRRKASCPPGRLRTGSGPRFSQSAYIPYPRVVRGPTCLQAIQISVDSTISSIAEECDVETDEKCVKQRISQAISWDGERLSKIVGDAAGAYEFSEEEEEVFKAVESAMRRAVRAFCILALSEASLTIAEYMTTGHVHSWAGAADSISVLVSALFIWLGSACFNKVYTTKGADIAHLMEGMVNLKQVFQNIALISIVFAMLQTATAATLWGPSALCIATASVVLTLTRIVVFRNPQLFDFILQLPHEVHHLIHKAPRKVWDFKKNLVLGAISYVGTRVGKLFSTLAGPLLDESSPAPCMQTVSSPSGAVIVPDGVGNKQTSTSSASAAAAGADGSASGNTEGNNNGNRATSKSSSVPLVGSAATSQVFEFSFTREQQEVFLTLAQLLMVCCVAKIIQAISEMVLVVAEAATDHRVGALSYAFDIIEVGIAAGLFYRVSQSFRQVLLSPGQDIPHVLEGLGGSHGVAKLFQQLARLSVLLACVNGAQLLLIALEHVAPMVGFHAGHHLAHAWHHTLHAGLHLLAMLK